MYARLIYIYICIHTYAPGYDAGVNFLFGVKFDHMKQIEWFKITFIALGLDLVVLSFIKVLSVWLIPRSVFGIFLLGILVAFVFVSAYCGVALAETDYSFACAYLSF